MLELPERFEMLSIIIPFFNCAEYTNLCLESIYDNTKDKFEIILVDNGSNPPFSPQEEYCFVAFTELNNIKHFHRSGFEGYGDIKIIRNDINKGFPAAVNQGLAASTGDIICVLNNDLVVSPDWAKHLEWHLNHGLDVVGPRTNYINGPQILLVDQYNNKQELYERAKEHYIKNKHKQWRFPRLVGFCLMFKREVYEKIGGFDEIFGIGNFEDDDWCMRAINAGYRLGISRDCYLHHFGSITHKLLDLDYKKLLAKNHKIFQSRWSDEKIDELNTKNKEK